MIKAQQLYQQSIDKTRVVIITSKVESNIAAMLLHVLNYHNKSVDYVLSNGKNYTANGNEFVVIETAKDADVYKANIALLIDVNPEIQAATFVNSITDGGMLVYNEEVAAVKLIVESSTNTIKKYPYQAPDYILENDVHFIDTNEGSLPLQITNAIDLKNIFGVKWICQHMGIDEDDFFEAVGTFNS